LSNLPEGFGIKVAVPTAQERVGAKNNINIIIKNHIFFITSSIKNYALIDRSLQ
jgi:hypothetical protein